MVTPAAKLELIVVSLIQEWGQPRVPVLITVGGDQDPAASRGLPVNPHPEWTRTTLERIQEGTLKKVRYWDPEDDSKVIIASNGQQGVDPGVCPPAKKQRREVEPVPGHNQDPPTRTWGGRTGRDQDPPRKQDKMKTWDPTLVMTPNLLLHLLLLLYLLLSLLFLHQPMILSQHQWELRVE